MTSIRAVWDWTVIILGFLVCPWAMLVEFLDTDGAL